MLLSGRTELSPLETTMSPLAGMEKKQKPGPMRLASPETIMYHPLVYRSVAVVVVGLRFFGVFHLLLDHLA